ncbi:MAG TPA: zinc ribbon domain-containing protein [Candidatus Latescibacteria bacterium]|nr:zinc ribbon domain-containing protein [Candidatus Latescibacterota bacterium]HIM56481.1 zinc ribbon domain-containing protein [Candidatus Latescibacterota bacterium]
MPIREYHCAECGHEFEVLEGPSTSPTTECEVCGAEKLERQLSVFAAQVSQGGGAASDPSPGCGNCAQNPACPWEG